MTPQITGALTLGKMLQRRMGFNEISIKQRFAAKTIVYSPFEPLQNWSNQLRCPKTCMIPGKAACPASLS